jgi:hypothetical protein
MHEEAVALASEGTSDATMCLNSLACALQRRYERTGLLEDLNCAIRHLEHVLSFTPHVVGKHHFKLSMYMNNLGSALRSSFII